MIFYDSKIISYMSIMEPDKEDEPPPRCKDTIDMFDDEVKRKELMKKIRSGFYDEKEEEKPINRTAQ